MDIMEEAFIGGFLISDAMERLRNDLEAVKFKLSIRHGIGNDDGEDEVKGTGLEGGDDDDDDDIDLDSDDGESKG